MAIMPCWRFLLDHPVDCLQRLAMMTRGIADPLASAYCRLYMVHRAQRLPECARGYLKTCINDLKVLLMRIVSATEITYGRFSGNRRLLISLMEPTIEYLVKCIFKDSSQTDIDDVLVGLGLWERQSELFGKSPCISIVLYHLLRELPIEVVSSTAVEILHLIECSDDCSFDQCLNYRLLGFRLCESMSQRNVVDVVMDKVLEVVSQYNSLDEYSKVVDPYMDIVLQNQMDNYLNVILDGIFERACNEGVTKNSLASLQSILVKLLTHFNNSDVIFALNHFIEILDVMHGSSRSIVSIHILNIATRNGCVRDPTTIQLLFEVSQVLHDGIDFSNSRNNDNQQPAHLISQFVHMVDYGSEVERHLTFLLECREAFGSISELKETLIHSSNRLAIKAMKEGKNHYSFVRSCLAFSEVTIPSIQSLFMQLNLYLETAEVALLGGLVSHSDGLIDSAIICLQNFDVVDGLQMLSNVDGIPSLTQKLCSLVVLVPGNPEQGITHISKSIVSLLNCNSWVTARVRIRVLCAIVSLSATLSQNELPYHSIHKEVIGNDHLFFGDPTYLQEFLSLSSSIIQNIFDVILQEPSQASRGTMALEACNCIASSFKLSGDILAVCSRLMETAKVCLSANDRYLLSTMKFFDRQRQLFLRQNHE
ncbi:unnamed protein product [Ilex paraguariensis]|uniref:Uncharacterized protein n=1 Tax=Ilex paraguariensis TaxID=185542 RepID=A0ABC8UJ44_9AQUA